MWLLATQREGFMSRTHRYSRNAHVFMRAPKKSHYRICEWFEMQTAKDSRTGRKAKCNTDEKLLKM